MRRCFISVRIFIYVVVALAYPLIDVTGYGVEGLWFASTDAISGKCIYAFNRNDCRSLKEKRKNEERRYENEICKNSLRRYSGRGDGIYIPT